MNDPRRGVPSASAMERYHQCQASFHMEKYAGDDTCSEAAASGTRIHAVLAGEAGEETLSAAELETAEMCEAQAKRLIEDWAQVVGCDEYLEQRMGLTALGAVKPVTDDSPAKFIFTGQADLVLVSDGRALVIDYKTGRGDTAIAKDNAQLASLAVLVSKFYRVSQVRVAIVQPWAGKPTVADYDQDALHDAWAWLTNSLRRIDEATPEDREAGDWCKWCKAQASCETLRNSTLQQLEVVQPMSIAGMAGDDQRKAMWARAMDLSADTLAAAYRGLAMVKRYVAAIEGVAKDRAQNDADFQRYFVTREKKGRRSVSDVGLVFQRCNTLGVSPDAFTAECSIPLGSVKELIAKATGSKGKALTSQVDEALRDATETSAGSLELVEVGATLEGEA